MQIVSIHTENGCIYPNDLKRWYFPNWFNKEHFSIYLGLKKDMSQLEFERWKKYLEDTSIADEVSIFMREFLNDCHDDFKLWQKSNYKITT